MDTNFIAWLILRATFAWMFLYPLKSLFADWPGAQGLVSILLPQKLVPVGSCLMVAVMVVGSLSILLGVFPRVGGLMLGVYSLIGTHVHYTLAKAARAHTSSPQATDEDQTALKEVIGLAVAGHVTSAQKNFVLAAVGFFFALSGGGPAILITL